MAQRSRRNTLITSWSLVLSLTLTGWLTVPANSAEPVFTGQVRGGRVEGIVVSADTGAPLVHITVWLAHKAEKAVWAPNRTARTDEFGRFGFDQINPGRYSLSVGLEGHLTRIYPDRQTGDQSDYLEVEEGGVISGLRIDVQPGGKISGTVRDRNKKPLPDSIVKLLELRETGEPYVVAETRTDQSGRYHLEKIHPKRYLLRANRVNKDQSNQSMEVGYYPNADSADSAMPISIDPRIAMSDLDITVGNRVRAAVITGTVTDKLTGKPLRGVPVAAEERWRSFHRTKTAADGSYRLEALLPGRYLLKTEGREVGYGYLLDVKELSVTDDHVINIALIPAPLIIATVQYVGRDPHPAACEYSVTLEFNCRNCTTHWSKTYGGKEDVFEFHAPEIAPVRIGAGFANPRYRVERVLLGDQDITDKWTGLGPGEKLTNVRILITDQQGPEPKTEKRRPAGPHE
jgi:protocatechuate 3,4-dioxygenase beta subunit